MAYHRAIIRQAELTRVAKALLAAGVSDFEAVFDPSGTIRVIVTGGNKTGSVANDWD